jgi:hypothetical protein
VLKKGKGAGGKIKKIQKARMMTRAMMRMTLRRWRWLPPPQKNQKKKYPSKLTKLKRTKSPPKKN